MQTTGVECMLWQYVIACFLEAIWKRWGSGRKCLLVTSSRQQKGFVTFETWIVASGEYSLLLKDIWKVVRNRFRLIFKTCFVNLCVIERKAHFPAAFQVKTVSLYSDVHGMHFLVVEGRALCASASASHPMGVAHAWQQVRRRPSLRHSLPPFSPSAILVLFPSAVAKAAAHIHVRASQPQRHSDSTILCDPH